VGSAGGEADERGAEGRGISALEHLDQLLTRSR